MHDLVIRGAEVHDGLGGAPRIADVAVDQGRITTIGQVAAGARQEVDARGLTLMPGIVDLHTHFDAQVTWDRTLSPSPALGVTTAVLGNCGFGIAPCPAPLRDTMIKNLSVVEGMDLNSLRTGIQWDFESFSEYLQQLRRTGPYLNTAVFAGHSVLRTAVMGDAGSEQVEPTDEQLDTMCRLLRESMQDGAIGLASSFSPNHSGYGGRPMPSTIATERELKALTGVLGEVGKGVFMMATGPRGTPDMMESIVEANGRPAYISTVLTMYNEANPGLGLTYYDRCAQALDRGHELYILTSCQPLSFDFTLTDPYVLLSHSAFDIVKKTPAEALAPLYADPAFRQAFRDNLRQPRTGILFLGNWNHIEVGPTALPEHHELEGLSMVALGQRWGKDPLDAFFDLALAENLQTHFVGKFFQNVDDGVAPLLKHRAGVVTLSDAGAHLSYMCDAGFGLHFLAHWVRDTGHFSLTEGIRKLTSEPAQRFRIPERGRLVEGAPADLLLFDPATVGISKPIPRQDLPGGGTRMVRESRGVHGVWVNGVLVHDGHDYVTLDHGPGQVLDRFDA
ncbi:MAG: N-acyl-D-amino-acid deacylase family protein [Limnohabitans sp.]|nr:amidohydrolase family protein [Burkholderiaceae bacterium]